jgi:hypothetical protein
MRNRVATSSEATLTVEPSSHLLSALSGTSMLPSSSFAGRAKPRGG